MYKMCKTIAAASLALTIAGTFSACGQRASMDNATKTQTQTQRINQSSGTRLYGTELRPDMVYRYANIGKGRYDVYGAHPYASAQYDQKAAERVAQTAANINGVTRADAIVYDGEAIIGIDGGTPSNKKMLERSVHEAIRRNEPGYRVHVTADKELVKRIRTLRNQAGNAHATRTTGQAIQKIISDIDRTITTPFH
jgi:hypothetical protein